MKRFSKIKTKIIFKKIWREIVNATCIFSALPNILVVSGVTPYKIDLNNLEIFSDRVFT